jgi:hypothetical protein
MMSSALALPAPEDYVVSPGFAGLLIVLAAIVLFCAVLYVGRRSRQRLDARLEQEERQHQERREDRDRSAVIDRCWQRLVWLVETAGTEPAAQYADEAILGLGPELALELLQGVHRDATDAGDETLSRASAVYLTQYALVLGHQAAKQPELPARRAGAGQGARATAGSPPAPARRAHPPVDGGVPTAEKPADKGTAASTADPSKGRHG